MPEVSNYEKDVKPRLDEIRDWLETGKCKYKKDVATKLGIARSTMYVWLKEYPEFEEVMKLGEVYTNERIDEKLDDLGEGYYKSDWVIQYDANDNIVSKTEYKKWRQNASVLLRVAAARMPDKYGNNVQHIPEIEDDGMTDALNKQTSEVWSDDESKKETS